MKPSKGTLRVRAAIDAGFGIKALADACHCSSSQIRSATAGAVPKVTVAIELLRVLGVPLTDWALAADLTAAAAPPQ